MKDINNINFKGRITSHTPFRFKELREFVLELKEGGCLQKEMVEKIKEKWPDNPEYHVSEASISRFLKRYQEHIGIEKETEALMSPISSRTNEDSYLFLIYNELQEISNTLIDIRDTIEKQNDILKKMNLNRGNFKEVTE